MFFLYFAYLYHSDYLTGRILDRHAQHGGVFETGVFVHGLIETAVVVSVGDVYRLKTTAVRDEFDYRI